MTIILPIEYIEIVLWTAGLLFVRLVLLTRVVILGDKNKEDG